MPKLEGNLTQRHEICSEERETLGYHTVKTRSLYLTWAWNGTGSWHQNGQTDGQNYDHHHHHHYGL